ncbi:MAG: carboxylate-amine ligase [Bacteroidota bacterium]|nr:carboxylate-amine ligase [Bacteroidota bacterium]MDE2833943.1 carboxylate-amine ligase [Bacteroidota bacterium]
MTSVEDLLQEPSLTIGIEEEYMIVDRETGDLIREAPRQLLKDAEAVLENQVAPEFFQSQIEVGTRVCRTVSEARSELVRLRRGVSEVVEPYGFAIIAASTHPNASYATQLHTPRERYQVLAQNMAVVGRRMVISGMHVHAGIEDDDLRIDLMNQTAYVLPHLLALSTSSPFWEGVYTGLKSYRIAVWNELPRTGLPEAFESYAEYERHVMALVYAGVIEDSSKIWWDIRPSKRFPTLEMRVADTCTRVEDAVCIAALYKCWLHMLWRLRRRNQRWRSYANMLIYENRWRAQRYGTDGTLIDFGRGVAVRYDELIEELLGKIMPDAEHFGCVEEVQHARAILARGTSAHWQIRTFNETLEETGSERAAIKAVVDMLIAETMHGL